MSSCKKKPSSDEVVIGTLDALPGGFAIRGPGVSPPTTPSGQSPDNTPGDPPPAGSSDPSGNSPLDSDKSLSVALTTQTVSPFLRKVCKPDL